MDHPESFKGYDKIIIFFNFTHKRIIPLFSISRLLIASYFWYQTTIETEPLTFLHFNWMIKEYARSKKFKFQTFIFFTVNPRMGMGGKQANNSGVSSRCQLASSVLYEHEDCLERWPPCLMPSDNKAALLSRDAPSCACGRPSLSSSVRT